MLVLSCPDNDKLCQSCNGDQCAYCVFSYPDEQGICQIVSDHVTGCYSYSSDGVCARCEDGFYLFMGGFCHAFTERNAQVCLFS